MDEDTGEVECTCSKSSDNGQYIWEVNGLNLSGDSESGNERSFCIRAKNVVLAVGTSDVPNNVSIPGKDLPFVRHCVKDVASELEDVKKGSEPVLVVGAGLSAADAIQTARNMGLNVIHVFRETPCGNPVQMLKKLPKAIYPEYVEMYELMCGDLQSEWYRPYPHFQIVGFLENNRVMLQDNAGVQEILETSVVLMQIGTSPDLTFMPTQATNLGLTAGLRVNPKHNPLDVDPFTNESTTQPGLYGIGPLVGDNFVRFIKGGAVAITQHIQMKLGMISM